jgi:hypothetical protein
MVVDCKGCDKPVEVPGTHAPDIVRCELCELIHKASLAIVPAARESK